MKEDARTRLKTALADDARPPIVEERVTSGKPFREILRIADETNADVIVTGVHGRGVVDRWFFGATANHVVRAARQAVLTLRAASASRGSDADASLVAK